MTCRRLPSFYLFFNAELGAGRHDNVIMYYLDKIHQLAHDCNLTEEELSILRKTTDNMVWNRIHDLSYLEQNDELSMILRKIDNANQMKELEDLLRRNIDFDNTDLDEGVAGVH